MSRYISLEDASSWTISNRGQIRENHVHLHHHHHSSSRELYVEGTSSFTSRPCEDIFDGVPNSNATATADDDEVQQRQERYLCHYARHCHGCWPSTLLLPLILCREFDASICYFDCWPRRPIPSSRPRWKPFRSNWDCPRDSPVP